jgi:integrase/recombinase XerD
MHSLTREELRTLLESVKNLRHRLMLKVAFNHALRVTEVTNLTARDCRDGYITCKRLKGSLKTTQPYVVSSDPLLDEATELRALVATLKPGDILFPITRSGVQKLVLRNGTRAGLPRHKLHPHALKHSVAMQTIKVAGIENVRQWLGHKSMSSTGEYLKVDDDAAAVEIARAMGA